VRVDQPGRDQPAAPVLHVVHVHDVVADPGTARRRVGGVPHAGDPVAARDHGGVAQNLRPGPQAADIGQQANSHRRSPPGPVISRAMNDHLPCLAPAGFTDGHWMSFACAPHYESLRRAGPLANVSIQIRYCTATTADKPFGGNAELYRPARLGTFADEKNPAERDHYHVAVRTQTSLAGFYGAARVSAAASSCAARPGGTRA